jgi:hypothetical protein
MTGRWFALSGRDASSVWHWLASNAAVRIEEEMGNTAAYCG